ncbi:MAG: aminotransferase class III-fold pyridoxal phosphate-dependent enzyme, partial [Janthinobacterium sp.]
SEDAEPPKRRKKNDPPPPPVECYTKKLMPSDALQIRGTHNASNALAALALCRAIGLPFAPLLHGLREYQGEPHRVELITAVNEVEYYDDSKGTNVGATVAALNGLGKSFGGENQRLVLIAGGDGKGQEFDPLAEPVSRYVRAVMLIGRDAPAIRAALADQLERLDHVMLAGCTHAPVVELSERLAALTGLGHASYASDGASATEIALKMSAHYWRNLGRPEKNRFVGLAGG